jgi:nucleoside triphosphate pyrophosphatase
MSLVLASNSPRRKHLLGLGGWVFRVEPAQVDENPLPGEDALGYVLRLAQSKAQVVAERSLLEDTILAADTTVVDEGQILGKPADVFEAESMLRRLRGRQHQVFTALAVVRRSEDFLATDWCVTHVPMRAYGDDEMYAYIATGDPLDKAGAYAIQHPDFRPVSDLEGCFANVMGLPLCHLARILRRLGIQADRNIPQACQQELEYNCSFFRQVMAD